MILFRLLVPPAYRAQPIYSPPHGNKDDLKDKIKSNSSTAQFQIIRTILSTAALRKLKMAILDISKAYSFTWDNRMD